MESETIFILYDGRAPILGQDEAQVMDVVTTEDQARKEGLYWLGYDAIWYECPRDSFKRTIGRGVPRYDLPPWSQKKLEV